MTIIRGKQFRFLNTHLEDDPFPVAQEAQAEELLEDIRRVMEPDRLEVEGGLALLATVGQGMARHIGVDTLAFISIDGLYRAMGEPGRNNEEPQFCDACFTGDYPIRLTDQEDKDHPAQLSLLAELG